MASQNSNGLGKCFILFMGVVILIEGAAYLGLSVWGIIYRDCSQKAASFTSQPYQFVTYLVYFTRETCGAPNIDIDGAFPLEMSWDKSSDITNRTFILLIAYAAVSSLWVLLSLLVIASICGKVTSLTVGICFWPWFLTVCAGSILDLTATGFHINDIIHTTNAQNTFDYIGVAPLPNEVMLYISSFDQYFVTPAIIMTCLSSRLVVIWFLNIFGCSFSVAIAKRLAEIQNVQQSNIQSASISDNKNTAIPSNQPSDRGVKKDQLHLVLTASSDHNSNEKQTNTMRSDRINDDNRVVDDAYVSNNATTYRSTEAHPDNLDYPGRDVKIASPELSIDSPLNNRYSDVFQFQQQSNRVSDELRSQLPWSYTNMIKPQPLRKNQVYPDIAQTDFT